MDVKISVCTPKLAILSLVHFGIGIFFYFSNCQSQSNRLFSPNNAKIDVKRMINRNRNEAKRSCKCRKKIEYVAQKNKNRNIELQLLP